MSSADAPAPSTATSRPLNAAQIAVLRAMTYHGSAAYSCSCDGNCAKFMMPVAITHLTCAHVTHPSRSSVQNHPYSCRASLTWIFSSCGT